MKATSLRQITYSLLTVYTLIPTLLATSSSFDLDLDSDTRRPGSDYFDTEVTCDENGLVVACGVSHVDEQLRLPSMGCYCRRGKFQICGEELASEDILRWRHKWKNLSYQCYTRCGCPALPAEEMKPVVMIEGVRMQATTFTREEYQYWSREDKRRAALKSVPGWRNCELFGHERQCLAKNPDSTRFEYRRPNPWPRNEDSIRFKPLFRPQSLDGESSRFENGRQSTRLRTLEEYSKRFVFRRPLARSTSLDGDLRRSQYRSAETRPRLGGDNG